MANIKDYQVQNNTEVVVRGIIAQNYLTKFNPSIVHFPAYTVMLKDPKVQFDEDDENEVKLNQFLKDDGFNFQNDPGHSGIVLTYTPMIHPTHPIIADELSDDDLEVGNTVNVKIKAVTADVFGQHEPDLMIVTVYK